MSVSATERGRSRANPQQQEAILTTEGPLLIIAGPGSGKTFTLVERIVHLITKKAVAPESLLVATFTDKAAREQTMLDEECAKSFHLDTYCFDLRSEHQLVRDLLLAKEFCQQIALASGMEYCIFKSTDAEQRKF